MDLEVSRRPQLVPAQRLRRAQGLALSEDEWEVLSLLKKPKEVEALVRALSWPRLKAQMTVRELALKGCLDTKRADYFELPQEGYFWGGMPLGELGEALIEKTARGISKARSQSAYLRALAAPLYAYLGELWLKFFRNERFYTRAAFNLPDVGQEALAPQFAAQAMALLETLPLEDKATFGMFLDGKDVDFDGEEAEKSFLILAQNEKELQSLIAEASLWVLRRELSKSELGSLIDDAKLLYLFIANHELFSGGQSPKRLPYWLEEE